MCARMAPPTTSPTLCWITRSACSAMVTPVPPRPPSARPALSLPGCAASRCWIGPRPPPSRSRRAPRREPLRSGLSGERSRRVQSVHGGALTARVGAVEGASPVQAELVLQVPAVVPDRAGVAENEIAVGRPGALPVEVAEIPDEHAFELRTVTVRRRGVWLTGLDQDSRRARQRGSGQQAQRRVRDRLPARQVSGLAGRLVQRGQPAEDHALVVGPGHAAVVLAPRGEAVIDQAAGSDEAAGMNPVPLPQRPAQVGATIVAAALMQPGGENQEQLVADRVLVPSVRVPPHATAAGAVPARHQVGEDRPGRRQVAVIAGEVVSGDPGKAPPAVVVIEADDEVPVPPRRGHEGPFDDSEVSLVASALYIADDRGQRVRGIPPACGAPPARTRAVPPLKRLDPGACLRGIVALRHTAPRQQPLSPSDPDVSSAAPDNGNCWLAVKAKEQGETSPRHFQCIAHPGTCRKPRVVPHNRRPGTVFLEWVVRGCLLLPTYDPRGGGRNEMRRTATLEVSR